MRMLENWYFTVFYVFWPRLGVPDLGWSGGSALPVKRWQWNRQEKLPILAETAGRKGYLVFYALWKCLCSGVSCSVSC